jgi:hypothetical protein
MVLVKLSGRQISLHIHLAREKKRPLLGNVFCLGPILGYVYCRRPLLGYVYCRRPLLLYVYCRRPLLGYAYCRRPLLGYVYCLKNLIPMGFERSFEVLILYSEGSLIAPCAV